MVTIKSKIREEVYQALKKLSAENYRTLDSEISYRLDKSIHYRTHLSDDDVTLFEMLTQIAEADEKFEIKKTSKPRVELIKN